ncbi:U2 small nuclear RNA auxiliary factor 2, partial [Rhizopus stolonifer]
ADLANSFLNSVGQELQSGVSGEGHYGHEGLVRYNEDLGYNEDYRRNDNSRDRRHSRDRYHDRSRDNRRRRSRERRERSPRHRSSRDDRDYRRRRRSPSPRRSSRRRSPSLQRRRDNENVIPLSKRERKLHNWDMAPAGMEGMTAEQVKSTGLFPLPGQVVGTRTPQSFQPPPINGSHPTTLYHHHDNAMMHDGSRVRVTQGAAGPVALNATLARQAKRLYVGQIPFDIDEKSMADFFNETIEQLKLADTTPVVAVQINHDKNYAFVEFHTSEQATLAMAVDGVMFQGQQLKIRRPKDYQPPVEGVEYTDLPSQMPGLVSTNVPDTPHKIFIGGLPVYLNDDQVVELLKSFGELRAFNLVKDPLTGANKGFAFCEYADPSVTDLACQGLNNMELGDRKLIVQRASVGAKHGTLPTEYATGQLPLTVADYLPISSAKEEEATRVLQLMNMVTPDELEDDEEYQDIWEDIAEECAKFGKIIDMKIPRPSKEGPVPGCGLIFVRYEEKEQTLEALRELAGRKFADRTVVATFIDEENYLTDNF